MKPTTMTVAARRMSIVISLGVLLALQQPYGCNGQPGGGGGGGGGTDSGGGGGPSEIDSGTDADVVYCDEDGTSAHYAEYLSGSGSTMIRYGGSETGCPNHVNWDLNPNSAAELPTNESIPAYPMMFESGGVTDLSSTANAVGIMRNGVVLYSAWAKDTVIEYEDTAFALEYDTFDLCGGHATTEGSYHYHGTPGCLQEQASVADGTSADEHSAQLGWAYDGFPLYGQLGPGGIEMKMCGLDGADDTVCLDLCSGYEAEIPGTDEFTYRYYLSCGYDESFFPFTTNCFRGCCPTGMTCSSKVEACGDSPEEGYTADYVPMAVTSLDEQYDADLIDGDDSEFIDDKDSHVDCSLYLGSLSAGYTVTNTSTTTPTPAPVMGATPAPSSLRAGTPSPASVTTTAPVEAGQPSASPVDTTPAPSVSKADILPTPPPNNRSVGGVTPSPSSSSIDTTPPTATPSSSPSLSPITLAPSSNTTAAPATPAPSISPTTSAPGSATEDTGDDSGAASILPLPSSALAMIATAVASGIACAATML